MMFGNNKKDKPILNMYYKLEFYYTTNFKDKKINNLINSYKYSYEDKYIILTWVLAKKNNDNKILEFIEDLNLNLHYNVQNIWEEKEKPKALHKYIVEKYYGLYNTFKYIRQKVRKIKGKTDLKEKELFKQRKNCLDPDCTFFYINSKTNIEIFNQIKILEEEKKYDEAITIIEKYLKSPKEKLSLNILQTAINISFKKKDNNLSEKYLKEFLFYKPNDIDANLNLGTILAHKHQENVLKGDKKTAMKYFSESLFYYEKYVSLEKNEKLINYIIGVYKILNSSNKYNDKITYYKNLLKQ